MLNTLRIATRTAALTAAIVLSAGLAACDDNSTIGNSIVEDEVQVMIDSTFTITGHTVDVDSVRSRTIVQILGQVDVPGYGTLRSDVWTQFMPALALDTVGITVNDIDSLKLVMVYESTAFTGDSIAPMGIQAFRLTKDLPTPIFSNFNPEDYYDAAHPLGQTIYSLANRDVDDPTNSGTRAVQMTLPRELAVDLYQSYLDNPANFASPTLFSKNVFKGLYLKSSYGSGRLLRVSQTYMSMFYHKTEKLSGTTTDTTYVKMGNYFAVTPEIVSNNTITLKAAQNIDAELQKGSTLIMAPIGSDAEIVFPAKEIISKYRTSIAKGLGVINNLTMTLAVDKIDGDNVTPPPYLLLVLKSEKEKFFADNNVANNKTSFYAAYDGSVQGYTFSGLREYLLDLMEKDQVTDEDVTFILTPVTVNSETSSSGYYYYSSTSTVTSIVPFVTYPVAAKLNYEKTKIKFVYSKQTINN